MHPLDWAIVAVSIVAAFHGYRVGAVAQLLSLVGFLIGIVIGVAVLFAIAPHLKPGDGKTAVAVACLILPSSILGATGHRLGELIWSALRRAHFGPVDAAGGAVIAVAGTLLFCWLLASILVNSTVPSVSAAVGSSRIIRGIESVMPPVPDAFSAVERYITQNGFPDALINVLPESPDPVKLPSTATVEAGVAASGASVVKIVSFGCGYELEGSGFVTTDGLVVTNAHVIAGTASITVDSRSGEVERATPVYFNPELDLAVLSTSSPLGVPDLTISTSFATRGDPAVVIGYPGGGPFTALPPAGILARFVAQGRDIYDTAVTDRIVYQLQAVVRPGNSGGPLVTPSGVVIGVVFSRSTTNPDVGYALASPAVESAVAQAETSTTQVSTEGCVG